MPGRFASVFLFGCLGSFLLQAQIPLLERSGSAPGRKRPVNVDDVVTMTQTGDRNYLDVFSRSGNVALFSPDKSKFAFVTQKGDLASDTVVFKLLVFNTSDAFASPHPETVATMASSSNREAISHVQWLSDNHTLVFLGEHPGGVPQVYRSDSRTAQVGELTHSATPVVAFAMSGKGDDLVYVADLPATPAVTPEMRRRGFAVTSQRWDDLYTDRGNTQGFRKQLFVKTGGMKQARRAGGPLCFQKEDIPISVSPNGRFAVVGAFATNPPASWAEYKTDFPLLNQFCSEAKSYLCPLQYILVDLLSGTARPLLNAPQMQGIGEGSEVFAWTKDNSLLLINAFLPLDELGSDARAKRRENVYVVEIFPASGKMVTIREQKGPFTGSEIQADSEHNRFVVGPSDPVYGPPTEFRKDADGWHIAELPHSIAAHADTLSVSLEEDINTPPRLVAADPATEKKSILLDLNPQFNGITFGHVELFRWKTRDGHVAEGSLYFPPDYVAGKKYPLVIQTHGHSRERFWIDGPFSTAFAAQPLANHGFLVLQMGIGDRYDKDSLKDWARMLDTSGEAAYALTFLESAVDALDQRGLIDKNRVGLTGFSRTVYHVLYALTRSDHHFAAAVLADGVNFGYVGCLYYLLETSSKCEEMNGGGPPFGAALSKWEKAPTFNLDKIESPVLLQGITGPLGEWEIFAGLRWLKKPVEMLNFYPEGQHVLVRPQQRLLSQGSVVDWYRFWLKGETDSDPGKASQYARWAKMREHGDKPGQQSGR